MRQHTFYIFLIIIIAFASCKKDDTGGSSYLTLKTGESAFEVYEGIQVLYEQQKISDLLVQDSFLSLIAAKHHIELYNGFILLDSIHPDTMIEYEFQFEGDTVGNIYIFPDNISINQWPQYQVSNTTILPGIGVDELYDLLDDINQKDTFERINRINVDYKNLEKRFSNNMYDIDTWFSLENIDNTEYTIEMTFKNGVLTGINRYKTQ